MDILSMLVIIGCMLYFKITTRTERNRWWWNVVAVVMVMAALGIVYEFARTGSIPAPCCEGN